MALGYFGRRTNKKSGHRLKSWRNHEFDSTNDSRYTGPGQNCSLSKKKNHHLQAQPSGTWSAHIVRAAMATPVSPNQNGGAPENPVSPQKPAGRLDRLKKNNGGQRQNKCSRGFLAIFGGGQALCWTSLLPAYGRFPK